MALTPDTDQFSQFLRLAFLRSPNFVTGVTGWTINQDGSAEFNNITIRNGEIISGVFLLYSGAIPAKGNLVLAFAPRSGGTDAVGNVYPQGFNFGVWNASGTLAQHFGIDNNGKLYLADSTGKTRIFLDPSIAAQLIYDTSGQSAGHLIASIASAAGTDSAGNAFDQGITSYSTAINAVVQMLGGSFNFGSAAQIALSGGKQPGSIGLQAATEGTVNIGTGINGASDSGATLLLWSKNAGGAGQPFTQLQTVLELFPAASVPAQQGDTILYDGGNAFPHFKPGSIISDPTEYQLGHRLLVSPGYTGTNVLTNITGLTVTLGNGAYEIYGELIISNGGVAQAINFGTSFAGTLSDMRLQWYLFQNDWSAFHNAAAVSQNNITHTATPTLNLSTSYLIIVSGYINASGGGLFGLQTQASNPFSILADSFMKIVPAN